MKLADMMGGNTCSDIVPGRTNMDMEKTRQQEQEKLEQRIKEEFGEVKKRKATPNPEPQQNIGEWADEMQVAAYELEQKSESVLPFVVDALLEEDTNNQVYSVMVKNMTQTELELALDAETRPEGLKLLKSEAINRGMIEHEPVVTAGAQMVPIGQIYPNPNNPRKRFDQDELDKLTASVRQLGILSPILVVVDGDRYRIVAGERRYRAAKAAGLDEVPVLVRELSEAEEFEVMLTENLQREDLDPIEEAQAYAEAISRGWKQTELAERLGISQAQVANRIRLLKLPEEVQEDISREIISPGHGLALVKVAHIPGAAKNVADTFAKRNTSVAKASEEVLSYVAREGKPLYDESMAWNRPLFDYQTICEKCEMRAMGRQNWENEEHPYCLKPECWERHQEEAQNAEIEKHIKEELGEEIDALNIPHTDELDPDSFEYFGRLVKLEDCEGCEHIEDVLNFDDKLVKVCANPTCYQAKVDRGWKKEQEDRQAEEDSFMQRKLEIVENFNCLNIWDPDSVNSAVFMVLRVFEMAAGSPSLYAGDTGSALFRYLNIEIPNGLTWEEESAILKKHLREMKSIPDMIDVVLFMLLNSARPYNKSWQLTFGAQEPEQDGEKSTTSGGE